MILVTNADDAGIDVARNNGILRAAAAGIVRSASLLAGAAAAADFARRARGIAGLGIGLHANFTEGLPLVSGHRSLTREDGRFLDKRELFRRSALGHIDEAEARRELEAQWRLIEKLGIKPTHVDGHNHAHLFPGIAAALPAVLPAGIWVRRPGPADLAGAAAVDDPLPVDPFASPELLSRTLEALARKALDGRNWGGFRSASTFRGASLPRGYGAGDVIELLQGLDAGKAAIVELMTHPGETCLDSVAYSASADREREVEALTSPRLAAFIAARCITLSSFGDLP